MEIKPKFQFVEGSFDTERVTLLRAKKSKIKQLQDTPIDDDLFSLTRQSHNEKMQNVQGEIDALERGEFNYYVPPEYINTIKKWITPDETHL